MNKNLEIIENVEEKMYGLLSTEELQQMVTNFEKENLQQHSIDLNLIKVEKILEWGFIPKEGKTQLAGRQTVELNYSPDGTYCPSNKGIWYLNPGVYDVMFAQGIKILNDRMCLIKHRSSLGRNGSLLRSALFDAGFKTENLGAVLFVHAPVMIEYGARIGTLYGHTSKPVDNLYNGQWQNDKQRQTQ